MEPIGLALSLFSVGSEVLSAMVKFVEKRAKMKEQWKQLQVDLSKWSDQLEQVAVAKPNYVRDLQEVVKEFRVFLRDTTMPPIFKPISRRVMRFSELLAKLEAKIKGTSFLMTAEILLEVVRSNSKLDEIRNQNNLTGVMLSDKMDYLKEVQMDIKADLDKLLKTKLDNRHIQPQLAEDFRGALADFQGAGSDNEKKRKAKDKLLELVQDWTGQDALKVARTVALLFVLDGEADVKLAGLDILVQMSEDGEKRKWLLASITAFKVLLATAQGVTTDPATRRASQCLINLVTAEPATFFNKWENMHKRHRKVVDDGLMEQIVAAADVSIGRLDLYEKKQDDQALRVLAKLAGIDDCKPAVAKAGGIAALVKLYYFATENMSIAKPKATVSSLALLAINALASLAVDATCRESFAEEDGASIRPLVHFLWSCAALSTFNYDYKQWVATAGFSDMETGFGPLLTTFGRDRVTKEVWENEEAASVALCALLEDTKCRVAVMQLGNFIDVKTGEIPFARHSRTKSSDCGRSLAGWVALANQVVKGMEDIKEAKPPFEGEETGAGEYLTAPEVGPPLWPKERVALGPDLVRAVWNLVDDSATKSGVQAVKDLMKHASRASVLDFFLLCGQFKILDYTKLLDSSAPAIKGTRAIRWATEYEGSTTDERTEDAAECFWAACILMSALTPTSPSRKRVRKQLVRLSLKMIEVLLMQNSPNGNEDDKKLFMPLVEHWVIKTRWDDMNKNCIPLLGLGASRLTSPPDESEDEDDDSSSDGDRSGDYRSDSDGDESDTSRYSESSQESADDVVRDPRQECVERLADLWPDYEDMIRKECSDAVAQEVRKLLSEGGTVKEVVPDDASRAKDEINRKDNGDGSVTNPKMLVVEQVGTLPEKIRIQLGGTGTAIGEGDSPLEENEVLARTKLASDAGE